LNLATYLANSKIVLDIAKVLLESAGLSSCYNDVMCGQTLSRYFETLFDSFKTSDSIFDMIYLVVPSNGLEEPSSLLNTLSKSSRSPFVASFALLGITFVHNSNNQEIVL
jgi:hypothetical protein